EDAAAARGEPDEERHRGRCRSLFSSVARRWFALPPEYEAAFVESSRGFMDIQEKMRSDPRLRRLSLDLYPELNPGFDADQSDAREPQEQADARHSAELHVILQMLQAMENAWLSLNLEVHYAHPLNRGWMDVFHRWTGSPAVRAKWPLVRGEFGRGFVSFCETQMRLGVVTGRAVPLGRDAPPLLGRL